MLFVGILFAVIRLYKGPRLVDRVMSLDGIAVCVVGFMVLEMLKTQQVFYIDLILVFSLLNFMGVVAFVFYLNKDYKPKGSKEFPEEGGRLD